MASKRIYAGAIEDFITWYRSEPHPGFVRAVVLRYRYELEVRSLAYETSDNGLLNPDMTAGIRRVKGAKRIGMRLGNWLTAAQGKNLLAWWQLGPGTCRR